MNSDEGLHMDDTEDGKSTRHVSLNCVHRLPALGAEDWNVDREHALSIKKYDAVGFRAVIHPISHFLAGNIHQQSESGPQFRLISLSYNSSNQISFPPFLLHLRHSTSNTHACQD